MGVKVFNPTKKTIAVWWGHTPYFIGPGNTEELPEAVVKDCLKHKDYQALQIVDEKQQIPDPKPGPKVPKPWDNEDWDPNTAPVEELQDFASVFGLVWDEEDLDNNRAIIMDRLMEME